MPGSLGFGLAFCHLRNESVFDQLLQALSQKSPSNPFIYKIFKQWDMKKAVSLKESNKDKLISPLK